MKPYIFQDEADALSILRLMKRERESISTKVTNKRKRHLLNKIQNTEARARDFLFSK